MTDTEFMRVRLSGGRFKEAELPFFILGDLAPLQKMVIDVAKWVFKEKYERRRSPSGFDQTYLKIIGLHSGSSVAEIGIGTTRTILDDMPVPNQEHFEKAARNIVDVIRLAEQGAEHLNGHIPARCLGYFNRVGRGLLDNEAMEITTKGQSKARLTQQSREVLVRHSVSEIMRDITIRGVVSEADQKNMMFRLEPIHGAMVHCPFLEQHREIVIDALASYKNYEDLEKVQVRVQVTGMYDRQDRLKHIESVKSVEPLDPLEVDARLDEFRNLRNGWLEDGGVAPDHAGLDWLSGVFERYYPGGLQLPRTYPTVDGGVSLEWSSGAREIDIEVNLENRTGEWYVFNKDTKSGEEEKKLELDKPDDWKWVGDRLRDLME